VVPSNVSLTFIFRVRFLEIVSSGSSECAGDSMWCEPLSVDGRLLESTSVTCRSSGRRVGRQPEMMPTEGSTEDQMNTSLFAQLMSVVLTRWTIVMMRYKDAKQTLDKSVILHCVSLLWPRTYKLPSKNVRITATFCDRPMFSLSTLCTGIVRIHISPKRLIIPIPR